MTRKVAFSLFLLFVCLAVCLGSDGPLSRTGESKLHEICQNALAQTQLLQSMRFSFTTKIEEIGSYEGTFLLSGDRYYARVVPSLPGTDLKPSETAFDGHKYQVLDRVEDGIGEILEYSVSPLLPSATGTIDPLLTPYSWLISPEDSLRWSFIKDPATWEIAFKKAEYMGSEEQEDHQYEIVQLSGILPNTKTKVYFATDLNYYPLKQVTLLNDDAFYCSVEVTDFDTINFTNGLLVVPKKVQFVQEKNGKKIDGVSILHSEDREIGSLIEETSFTIPVKRAKRTRNLDLPQHTSDHILDNTEKIQYSFPAVKRVLVLIGLLVVFCSLILIILRRKHSLNLKGFVKHKRLNFALFVLVLLLGSAFFFGRYKEHVQGKKELKSYQTILDYAKEVQELRQTLVSKYSDPDECKKQLLANGEGILKGVSIEIDQISRRAADHYRNIEIEDFFLDRFIWLERLICIKSDALWSEGKYQDACVWNLLLMKLGMFIARGGNEWNCYGRVICFSDSSRRLFKCADLLSREDSEFLLTGLEEIDNLFEHDRSVEGVIKLIKKQNPFFTESRLEIPARYRDGCRTMLALCEAQLALREYKLQNGQYPESLEECVQSAEREILDRAPWGIIYRKEDDGYKLYSAGPDGVDDGGEKTLIELLVQNRHGDLVIGDESSAEDKNATPVSTPNGTSGRESSR